MGENRTEAGQGGVLSVLAGREGFRERGICTPGSDSERLVV